MIIGTGQRSYIRYRALILQRFCLSLTFLISLISGLVFSSVAVAENTITGLRLGAVSLDSASGLRIVVEQKNPIAAELFILDNPYRLVIDSPLTSWNVKNLPPSGRLESEAASMRGGAPAQPERGPPAPNAGATAAASVAES